MSFKNHLEKLGKNWSQLLLVQNVGNICLLMRGCFSKLLSIKQKPHKQLTKPFHKKKFKTSLKIEANVHVSKVWKNTLSTLVEEGYLIMFLSILHKSCKKTTTSFLKKLKKLGKIGTNFHVSKMLENTLLLMIECSWIFLNILHKPFKGLPKSFVKQFGKISRNWS